VTRILDPRNARSRRTRSALLAAARSLLEEQGFESLTMAAVAERADVTRRAVYLHFASRSELVAELFDFVSEAEGLRASTGAVWSAPDAAAALEEWAAHLARFHPQVLAITRATERLSASDPDAAGHRERYMSEQLTACRRLAAWLEHEARLAPTWTPETAADMLFALISTDVLERLLHQRRWSRRRLARHLALLLRSTFVADPDGERSIAATATARR
jgi:AcrR family transcriptional regulator